jgi:hypothetical protein
MEISLQTIADSTKLMSGSSHSHNMFSTTHDPENLHATDAHLGALHVRTGSQDFQHPDFQSNWGYWIEAEARRRLIGGCFIFDAHQAMYHEQNRSKTNINTRSSLLALPCPDNLWNARNPCQWLEQTQVADCTVQALQYVEQNLSPQSICRKSPFAQSLILCFLTTQLPTRDLTYPNDFLPHSVAPSITRFSTLFPAVPLAHAYLALHHTPLHDLLAIAGDTWVFAQKITPPSAFHAAQSRLKSWSSSLAAAAATQHACRVLQCSLSTTYNPSHRSSTLAVVDPGQACGGVGVSDYWSSYIAALICWAFGHRYQSSGGGSGLMSRTNSSTVIAMDLDIESLQTAEDARIKALAYATAMAEMDIEESLTSKAHMRSETSGVIDAVKNQLEIDGAGAKCGMLVDAVGVLNRIKEGGRGKWF